MTITNPIERHAAIGIRTATGPTLALTGALAATVAMAAVLQPTWPAAALAPAAAGLLFVLAAGTALVAWLRPVPDRHFTYWDAAGLLTFIGICAAAAVEPEQMTQLVAGAERHK